MIALLCRGVCRLLGMLKTGFLFYFILVVVGYGCVCYLEVCKFEV